MREKVHVEQARVFLRDKLEIVEGLMDSGVKSFVQKEGPNQILNLILEN